MYRRFERFEDRIRRRDRFARIPRVRLRDRDNLLEFYDAEQFKKRFHLAKPTALFVISLIAENLCSPIKRGVYLPPIHQLLIALNFYATGSFQLPIGDNLKVCQPTVSNVVKRVSSAIAKHFHRFVYFPNFQESSAIRQKFYEIGSFPGVTGAIDCTLIKINSPGGDDAELFRSRKTYFAINVQGVCDAELNFTNLVVRWFGSAHDSRIFDNSMLKQRLEDNEAPGLLLGDSGYPLFHYLMTPILNPTNAAQRRYNRSQIKTRNTIERCFGVWKRRFPCLNHLRLKLKTVLSVIVAVGVLHNISRKRCDIFEEDRADPFDPEDEVNAMTSLRGRVRQGEIIQSHFASSVI